MLEGLAPKKRKEEEIDSQSRLEAPGNPHSKQYKGAWLRVFMAGQPVKTVIDVGKAKCNRCPSEPIDVQHVRLVKIVEVICASPLRWNAPLD